MDEWTMMNCINLCGLLMHAELLFILWINLLLLDEWSLMPCWCWFIMMCVFQNVAMMFCLLLCEYELWDTKTGYHALVIICIAIEHASPIKFGSPWYLNFLLACMLLACMTCFGYDVMDRCCGVLTCVLHDACNMDSLSWLHGPDIYWWSCSAIGLQLDMQPC